MGPDGSFSVRAMAPADAASVAALIRTAFAAQPILTDPPPSALRVSGEDITFHLASGGGAVATAASGTAGAVLWAEQGGDLIVSRLAVAPNWRRRGVARALLAAAEAAARTAAVPRIRLSTRLVLFDNRRLFAASGFVETTLGTHPGNPEPTFVNLEKRLVSSVRPW